MKSLLARLASIQIEPPVPPLSLIASMELRTRFNRTCSICKTSTNHGRKIRRQIGVCGYPGLVKVRLAQFDHSLDDTLETERVHDCCDRAVPMPADV